MRLESKQLTCEINGRKYEWFGCFGAVLKSRERGVRQGDVRMLGDQMFHACYVWPRRFSKPEVCWIPCIEFDMEWVREFKKKVFA